MAVASRESKEPRIPTATNERLPMAMARYVAGVFQP